MGARRIFFREEQTRRMDKIIRGFGGRMFPQRVQGQRPGGPVGVWGKAPRS